MKNSPPAERGGRRSPPDRLSSVFGDFDYEEFLKDTDCCLFGLDSEGHFAEFGRRCEAILGFTRSELLRTKFEQVVIPGRRPALRALLRGRTPESPIGSMRLSVMRKDGATLPARIRVHADFREARAAHRRVILALELDDEEDRSEIRRIEKTLAQVSARLLQMRGEERHRIAHELHDTTGQNLAALQISLASIEKAARLLDTQAQQTIAECRQLAKNCAEEVRTLSFLLHPPVLKNSDLITVLSGFAEGFAKRTGVNVEIDLPRGRMRFPKKIEKAVLQTVQEGFTNIHRHSGSRTAVLRLKLHAGALILEIEDQGGGIASKSRATGVLAANMGVGIAGMREVARQLGGHVTIHSRQRGTLLRLVFPNILHREIATQKAHL